MDKQEQLMKGLGESVRRIMEKLEGDFGWLQEIRMRIGAPLFVIYRGEEYAVTKQGQLRKDTAKAYRITRQDLKETVELISSYSMYAYEEELRQGYITIAGGHRIGMAGKIIMDGRHIKTMRYISFLNIRLSHEVKGCAADILPHILDRERGVCQTLIISPPRCGKTTLLRDMIRLLSDGTQGFAGVTVGVADERSEIGACYLGEPQNDLGVRTDVLDGCPKAQGMMMLIRTMAPQVVAVDEIGSREELEAMEYAANCGCRLIATVHGSSFQDLLTKPVLKKMVEERMFDRFILLNSRQNPGNTYCIMDGTGKVIWQRRGEGKEIGKD